MRLRGRVFTALSVIITALSAATVASAQAVAEARSVAEPNTVTVTPFLTGAFGTSNGLGGSIGIGVGVGYDVTRNLGVEGEIEHSFDVLGNDANLDWSVTNYSANGIYHFDVKHVTPYATFGLGVEHVGRTVNNPDPAALYAASSTEIAYNFGGGVKYPLSERFILRADLRRFQSTDLSPDFWRLYGGVTFWAKR
ncbi:MAG: outer membrane protein [Vicinamibacterales bacterium]